MRERPILLKAEMVRAVLDGRKTQTRRMLTSRQLKMIDAAASIGECYPLESGHQHENSQSYYREWCPFGAVGNRLWVREAWARYNIDQDSHDIAYRATTPDDWPKEGRWRPSIHMPRWASRITLEITGVRVERLWEISEDDAKAEGCSFEALRFKPGTREVEEMGHTAVYQFGGFWQSIYGEESWQANPWVWVIEFKRVEGEA
ncbi:morphogenetic protein [Pantoea ananatis]|uniref:morphogenetic protein n=1 Tax=Pantoea ananas TaxID=553 RepID=UPI003CF5D816